MSKGEKFVNEKEQANKRCLECHFGIGKEVKTRIMMSDHFTSLGKFWERKLSFYTTWVTLLLDWFSD